MNVPDGPGEVPPAAADPRPDENPNRDTPAAEAKPKTRHVTEAMKQANRSNSKRSTGPKTPAGKRAVSTNAVTHGCCCKQLIFLDGEDPAVFQAQVDQRIKEHGVTTSDEVSLIEMAVYGLWTSRRAINASASTVNETLAEIRDRFQDGSVKEVRELIPRIATEPDLAVEGLSNSTRGIEFLLTQFALLNERLESYYSYEISQRAYALRVGGHRPNELFSDPDVFDFNKAYLGGISGAGGFTSEEAGNALQYDLPDAMSYTEFVRRLEPLVADLPTHAEGHRRLKAYIQKEVERLTERHELVGYREQRKFAAALESARSSVTKEGVTFQRYIDSGNRTFMAALRMLRALKKDRRDYGDTVEIDAATDATGIGQADSAPLIPVVTDSHAPEAVSSSFVGASALEELTGSVESDSEQSRGAQVVGLPGGNDVSPPAPASAIGTGSTLSAADHEAIRAQYRQTRDVVAAYLDKCALKEPSDGPTNS